MKKLQYTVNKNNATHWCNDCPCGADMTEKGVIFDLVNEYGDTTYILTCDDCGKSVQSHCLIDLVNNWNK